MDSLLWLGAIAFCLSLILTPIFRDIFRSYGVVDQPDQGRKIHKYPIPRVGGVAIAVSYVGAYLLLPRAAGAALHDQLALVWRLLPAGALMFVTGLVDDLLGLKPWQKLVGQFAAAGLAYWAGVRISSLIWVQTDNWWSLPVTIFWLIACTNAFNLVDGMDGLAGGVGLLSTLTIFLAALLHHNPALAYATLPLAGCLLGFLCYNFNPATIFLGDSGSLTLGFLLGCFGVIWSSKSATLLGMTAPLMALSIPLLDTSLAIVRRFLKRQPIFSADRGHIHHKLLDRGLTPRRAALVFYCISGLVACFSLLQSVVRSDRISGVIVVLFCFVAWIGVQYLGYAEFSVAGRMLFSGDFQRSLRAQLDLHGLEKSLERAQSLHECWSALRAACGKIGFECLELYWSENQRYRGLEAPGSTVPRWFMRVPLGNGRYVEFEREINNPMLNSSVVGPFVDVLHNTLRPRLEAIAREEARLFSNSSLVS